MPCTHETTGIGAKRPESAPNALKGQKLLAQGNALGIWQQHPLRPERAKALKPYPGKHKKHKKDTHRKHSATTA